VARADAASDATADTAPDLAADRATDAAPDSAPDAAPDGPSDPSPDRAPDIAPDQAPDAVPDTSSNLFNDDFGSGYEVNWSLSSSNDGPVTNTQDGINKTVALDATNDDYSRLRCNLGGDKFANTDVTASMKVKIVQAPSSSRTVRLDVRQSVDTENIFYAVGATIADDGSMTKVSIFKKVDNGAGNYTICSLGEGKFATPVAMNQWRTLRLSIRGITSVRLVAYFEDAEMARATDDCVSDLTATNGVTVANGGCLATQTGLGIQVERGITAMVDDVLVTGF